MLEPEQNIFFVAQYRRLDAADRSASPGYISLRGFARNRPTFGALIFIIDWSRLTKHKHKVCEDSSRCRRIHRNLSCNSRSFIYHNFILTLPVYYIHQRAQVESHY